MTVGVSKAVTIDHAPPGTLALTNGTLLEHPGDTATYRLFVITTTGHEAGSNPVTITRPAAPPPSP